MEMVFIVVKNLFLSTINCHRVNNGKEDVKFSKSEKILV